MTKLVLCVVCVPIRITKTKSRVFASIINVCVPIRINKTKYKVFALYKEFSPS